MNAALRPSLALILHTRDTASNFDGRPSAQDAVLSLHPITLGPDSAPVLDAGRLLTTAEAQVLGQRLQRPGAPVESDLFLPPNLLRHDATSLTWFRPPARSRQHWRTKDGRVALDTVLPGLLFHVQEGVLAVAAYVGDARPDERTALYAAPLGNVHADTLVCVGNAQLPSAWEPSTCKRWEAVLFDTNYAHVNHQHTLRDTTTTEQLIQFWTKRAKYASPPAERLLAPLKINAGSWVRRLMENAR